jgi:hypothetical protein
MSYSSPFLALPGEIRNQIYEYALTLSKDLYHREPTKSDRKRKKCKAYLPNSRIQKSIFYSPREGKKRIRASDEINQLQYVNRRLHTETGLLELQYNSFRFIRHQDDERLASSQLISFLRLFSATIVPWHLNLTMEDYDPYYRYTSDYRDYYRDSSTIALRYQCAISAPAGATQHYTKT